MTDTKNPPNPATGCAPLGRPMAETVSLELVWAVAYAGRYNDRGNYWRSTAEAACGSAKYADSVVADLLAAFPRGGA